jgi:hypothetical protein
VEKRASAITLVMSIVALLVVAAPAVSFVGGGTKPSEAPTIAWGAHYSGELTNHRSEANREPHSSDGQEVAFYPLPPVSVRDQVVVNWQSGPLQSFQWLSRLPAVRSRRHRSRSRRPLPPTPTSSSSPGPAKKNRSTRKTYPYGFSVEAPRHYVVISVAAFSEVAANGVIAASVTAADGTPAPDGLALRQHGCRKLDEGGNHTRWVSQAGPRSAMPRHSEIDWKLVRAICKPELGSRLSQSR